MNSAAPAAAVPQSGTGVSPVSPQPAPTLKPDESQRVLECGTSVPLCAKTSVSRPEAFANATSSGRRDACAPTPRLSAPHASVSPSLSSLHGTKVPAKSGTEVPHSKTLRMSGEIVVGGGSAARNTGEPPVPLSATAAPPAESSTGNNFDLIRLFAATQILLEHGVFYILRCKHGSEHLPLPLRYLFDFHGVAIFFVISGYLVTASWERTQTRPLAYLRNRLLRIYPALWFCLFLSFLLIVYLRVAFTPGELLRWLAANATILQPYNPEFFRAHGVGLLAPGKGTINGALWTITVELQFYAAFPFLHLALKKLLRGREPGRLAPVFACAAFVVLGWLFVHHGARLAPPGFEYYKYLNITFLPHFYLFLFGWALRKNFDLLAPILRGKAFYWIAAYCLLIWLRETHVFPLPRAGMTYLSFPYLFLGVVVVSCAHTLPRLSSKLLRGNDISYGVYIYHMPLLALFIELGLYGWLRYELLLALLFVTFLLAALSWRLIERPALSLKKPRRRT